METVEKGRLEEVRRAVRELGSVVIAFSGGVDSALLARLASDEPRVRFVLATAVSETFTQPEKERAARIAASISARHVVIGTSELDDARFRENSPERCYFCKRVRFGTLEKLRAELGFDCVADGSNASDERDYRPGAKAAREIGVRSPFAEIGLTKDEIRAISRELGLPGWDLPSEACLASRVPYGTAISRSLLRLVREAEEAVRAVAGIAGHLRVRHHGELARVETSREEIQLISDDSTRAAIVGALKALGYNYVTLDLEGYRSGSMNEILTPDHFSERDDTDES